VIALQAEEARFLGISFLSEPREEDLVIPLTLRVVLMVAGNRSRTPCSSWPLRTFSTIAVDAADALLGDFTT
jgi:hypothetical protein